MRWDITKHSFFEYRFFVVTRAKSTANHLLLKKRYLKKKCLIVSYGQYFSEVKGRFRVSSIILSQSMKRI